MLPMGKHVEGARDARTRHRPREQKAVFHRHLLIIEGMPYKRRRHAIGYGALDGEGAGEPPVSPTKMLERSTMSVLPRCDNRIAQQKGIGLDRFPIDAHRLGQPGAIPKCTQARREMTSGREPRHGDMGSVDAVLLGVAPRPRYYPSKLRKRLWVARWRHAIPQYACVVSQRVHLQRDGLALTRTEMVVTASWNNDYQGLLIRQRALGRLEKISCE